MTFRASSHSDFEPPFTIERP